MKNALRMYIKDLKSVRREYAIYFLFLITYIIVNHIMFADRQAFSNLTFFNHILLVIGEYHLFFFPGFLLYTFIREKISHTEYQNLFIPAGRGTVYFSKSAVVFSGLFIEIIVTAFLVIRAQLLPHRVDPRIIADAFLPFVGNPFISVSLVFLAWSVIQTFQRFRFTAGIAVGGAGYLLYLRMINAYIRGSFWEILVIHGVFVFALGIVYIVIGTFLFSCFADV